MHVHRFIAVLATALAATLPACQFDASIEISGNGTNGAVGAPDAEQARGPGQALSFDGNDFVELERTISDDFTLEAWIRTTDSRGGSRFYDGLGVIYADVGGSANDFGAAILNDHFCFGTGPTETTIESTTIVTTGEWLHVAAVRTMASGEIRLLVNGVEESKASSMSTGVLDASATINIGGNTIDSRFFSGTMDEVRIWNVARTNLQIQTSMATTLDGDEAGLIGYWRFDNDAAQIVDATSSANHGSSGGGTADQEPGHIPSDAPLR